MKVWECFFEYRFGQPLEDERFPVCSKQSVKIVDSLEKAQEFVKNPSTTILGKTITLTGYCGMAYFVEREVE